jgi:hypothetical protein
MWWSRLAPHLADPGVLGLPIALWFTETHHAGALIPAVTVAARTGGGVRAGALLPPQGERGRRMGAIRWQLRSGLVEAVDVEAAFHRRGADEVLAAAAGTLAAMRGWPALVGDLTERPLGADRPAGVERLVADLVPRLI